MSPEGKSHRQAHRFTTPGFSGREEFYYLFKLELMALGLTCLKYEEHRSEGKGDML